jgi:MFS family permease
VLAPALRDRYDLSLTEVGVVVAAEWVGLTIALLPWGLAVDRLGERWTVTAGLVACSAFLVGAAFARNYSTLVVFLALCGAAGGSVQSGSGRAVTGWFGPEERGLALGVRQTAVPVGGAIAAVAMPALGGPKAGFLFLAVFVLVGALAGGLVLRSGAEHALDAEAVESSLRDRRLWLASGASALYVVTQVVLMSFVVLFLHDAHGFSPGSAAAVFAAAQLLAAALRIGVGRWSDLLGSRVRPLRMIGIATASTVAVVALAADTSGWVLVPALVAATGLSMAWNGLAFTIAAELGGRRSGSAIAFQQTVLAAVGVAVPVVFAVTVSATSWTAAFALAALFPIGGWWVLRSLKGY